jgi:hypothetical protein
VAAAPLYAHHGNAAYDLDSPRTMKGTVTEFAWANPHVQIYFDTKTAKGASEHWASETVSPGLCNSCGLVKKRIEAWRRNRDQPLHPPRVARRLATSSRLCFPTAKI